jgi:hypothetical protein
LSRKPPIDKNLIGGKGIAKKSSSVTSMKALLDKAKSKKTPPSIAKQHQKTKHHSKLAAKKHKANASGKKLCIARKLEAEAMKHLRDAQRIHKSDTKR